MPILLLRQVLNHLAEGLAACFSDASLHFHPMQRLIIATRRILLFCFPGVNFVYQNYRVIFAGFKIEMDL